MVVTNAKPRCYARPKVVHDDIGGFDHLVKDSLTFRIFQVEHHAKLVPVYTEKSTRFAFERGWILAKGVASRWFNLDDLCPQVAQ